jgi:hypothetical protein
MTSVTVTSMTFQRRMSMLVRGSAEFFITWPRAKIMSLDDFVFSCSST